MHLFGLGGGAIWLWLVLVPLSGWLVLKSWFFRRFSWEISGYDRYFLIVLFGIFCVIAGIAVASVIEFMLDSPAFADIWQIPLGVLDALRGNSLDNGAETFVRSVFVVLYWSVPIGFAGSLILWWFSFPAYKLFLIAKGIAAKKPAADERRAEYLAKVNGILNFVKEADKRTSLTMLTLSNRKIYIGWPRHVSDWNNPSPPKQYLYFVPLYSGYRKQDSLEPEITARYAEAYNKYPVSATDFLAKMSTWEIIVPVNEIIHAQPFDEDFYEEIQRANPAPKRKPARKK